MARMRSVKPEFWADEDLASALSRDARLLYVGLWNLADEHGRLRGDPRYIKGQIFAYDDDLGPAEIDELLDALAIAKKAVRYRVAGARYLFLPNLAKHQRLEADKVPSRLPDPSEADPDPPPEQPQPSRANISAPDPDEPARGAKDLALKHVAGGREHVAGGREHVAGTASRHGAQTRADVPATDPTPTQRSKRITDAYAKAEPMSRWPAINGIVLTALKAGRWTDDQIRDALLRLAADRRSVTVDTLRVELDGQPPPGNVVALARASPRRRNGDDIVAEGLEIAARLQAQEQQ